MTQIEQLISKIEEKKYDYKAMLKSAEPNSEDFYCRRARVALCEELLIAAKTILKETASEDLEQAAIDYDSCRPALFGEDDEGDYVEYIEVRKDAFIAGAQWQREQMMEGVVKGQVERGYCEDGISEHFEVSAYLSGRDERFKDLSDGQSVKVIIIKE